MGWVGRGRTFPTLALIVVLLCSALVWAGPSTGIECIDGRWSCFGVAIKSGAGAAAVTIGRSLYVHGGYSVSHRAQHNAPSGPSGQILTIFSEVTGSRGTSLAYNKTQLLTSIKHNYILERAGHTLYYWNGKLILYGGFTALVDRAVLLGDVLSLDLATLDWELLHSWHADVPGLPRARYAHEAAVVADHLFIMGGQIDAAHQQPKDRGNIQVFDLKRRTWLPPINAMDFLPPNPLLSQPLSTTDTADGLLEYGSKLLVLLEGNILLLDVQAYAQTQRFEPSAVLQLHKPLSAVALPLGNPSMLYVQGADLLVTTWQTRKIVTFAVKNFTAWARAQHTGPEPEIVTTLLETSSLHGDCSWLMSVDAGEDGAADPGHPQLLARVGDTLLLGSARAAGDLFLCPMRPSMGPPTHPRAVQTSVPRQRRLLQTDEPITCSGALPAVQIVLSNDQMTVCSDVEDCIDNFDDFDFGNVVINDCDDAPAIVVRVDPQSSSPRPLLLHDLAFNRNGGGSVLVYPGVNITIQDCMFNDAPAGSQPSVRILTDALLYHMDRCSFEHNAAAALEITDPLPGSTTLVDCTFDGGSVPANGGAIRVLQRRGTSPPQPPSWTLELHNSTLSSNVAAGHGGALDFDSFDAGLSMFNVLLRGNRAGRDGGAVHFTSAWGTLQAQGCTADNNHAGLSGGALWAAASAAHTSGSAALLLRVANTRFENNQAGAGDGGALCASSGVQLRLLGDDSRQQLIRNSSPQGAGGAVHAADGSILSVSGGLFQDNSAVQGGAISCVGCLRVTVVDTELTENDADTTGGALHLQPRQAVNISSATVTTNTAITGGALYIDTTTFQDGAAGTQVMIVNTDVKDNAVQWSDDIVAYDDPRGAGGGMYLKLAGPTVMLRMNVSDNTARIAGGAFLDTSSCRLQAVNQSCVEIAAMDYGSNPVQEPASGAAVAAPIFAPSPEGIHLLCDEDEVTRALTVQQQPSFTLAFPHSLVGTCHGGRPVIATAASSLQVDESSLEVESGVPFSLTLSVRDLYGQLPSSPSVTPLLIRATFRNTSQVQSFGGHLPELTGASTLLLDDWTSAVNFSGLIVLAEPGSSGTLRIEPSHTLNIGATARWIKVRGCYVGEALADHCCTACGDGQYSVLPPAGCATCPSGGNCSHGWLLPLPGYWQQHPRIPILQRCIIPSACEYANRSTVLDAYHRATRGDWQVNDAGLVERFLEDQCAPGYARTLCGVCDQGFGRTGVLCSDCWRSRTAQLATTLITLAQVVLLVLQVVLHFAQVARPMHTAAVNQFVEAELVDGKEAAGPSPRLSPLMAASSQPFDDLDHAAALLRITLDFLQLLGALKALTIDWSPDVLAFLNSVDVTGAAMRFPLYCSLSGSARNRALAQVAIGSVLPLMFIAAAVLLWHLLHWWARLMRRPFRHALLQHVVVSILFILRFFYATTTEHLLSIFAVVPLDGVKGVQLRWAGSPDTPYAKGAHLVLMLALGLPGICLLALGFPAIIAALLGSERERLHQSARRGVLGMLYEEHRIRHWQVVMILRQLLLVGCTTLLGPLGPGMQLLTVLAVLGVSFWAHSVVEPYTQPVLRFPASVCLLVVQASVVMLLYMSSAGRTTELAFERLFIVANCMVIAYLVGFLLLLLAKLSLAALTMRGNGAGRRKFLLTREERRLAGSGPAEQELPTIPKAAAGMVAEDHVVVEMPPEPADSRQSDTPDNSMARLTPPRSSSISNGVAGDSGMPMVGISGDRAPVALVATQRGGTSRLDPGARQMLPRNQSGERNLATKAAMLLSDKISSMVPTMPRSASGRRKSSTQIAAWPTETPAAETLESSTDDFSNLQAVTKGVLQTLPVTPVTKDTPDENEAQVSVVENLVQLSRRRPGHSRSHSQGGGIHSRNPSLNRMGNHSRHTSFGASDWYGGDAGAEVDSDFSNFSSMTDLYAAELDLDGTGTFAMRSSGRYRVNSGHATPLLANSASSRDLKDLPRGGSGRSRLSSGRFAEPLPVPQSTPDGVAEPVPAPRTPQHDA